MVDEDVSSSPLIFFAFGGAVAKRASIYRTEYIGDIIMSNNSSNYGCLNFLFDIFMICITGGLWLIWIFVREMRKR